MPSEEKDSKQKRSGQADKKGRLAMESKHEKELMVSFDSRNGLSTGEGLEMRIIQPKSSEV